MRRIRFLLAAVLIGNGIALHPARAEEPDKAPPPNALLDVSAKLIDAAARQSVDRLEPFAKCKDEAIISGTAKVVGKVRAALVPDPCRGVIDLVFSGQIDACATVQHPMVLVDTRVLAPLVVHRRVVLTPKGICSIPGPAAARALIALTGATDHHGDPEATPADIARLRFRQDREDLEASASREIAQGASQRFGDELAPILAATSRRIGDSLRTLKEIGVTVEDLRFRTTPTHLEARLAIATPDRPASENPPEISDDADLTLRVHASLLNQAAEAALGGKTFRLSEVRGLLDEATGRVFEDDRDMDERKRSVDGIEKLLKRLTGEAPTLTFAKKEPLTVAFTKDDIRVEANIASVTVNGVESSGTLLRAVYRVEHKADKVIVRRTGPVLLLVRPPSKTDRKLPPLDAARRLVLEAVVIEILKSRLTLGQMSPPAGLADLEPLRPSRVEAENGWFVLSWKLASAPSKE